MANIVPSDRHPSLAPPPTPYRPQVLLLNNKHTSRATSHPVHIVRTVVIGLKLQYQNVPLHSKPCIRHPTPSTRATILHYAQRAQSILTTPPPTATCCFEDNEEKGAMAPESGTSAAIDLRLALTLAAQLHFHHGFHSVGRGCPGCSVGTTCRFPENARYTLLTRRERLRPRNVDCR